MTWAIQILRWIHIGVGGVALLTLWVPLVVQKGSPLHRKVGNVYVWAMFAAATTAVLLAPLRMIQLPVERWRAPLFLAYVALLSFACAFYGKRVLRQKGRTGPSRDLLDLGVPVALLVATGGLIAFGLWTGFRLALWFSPVGLLVALPQLRGLLRAPPDRRWWLVEHLRGMVTSGITTVTAFAVVNARVFGQGTFSVAVWLAPTILGVPFLIYWQRAYGAGKGRLAAGALEADG